MYLRNIAVGLSALVLLSTAAHARSLPDLYTATEQRASFDGCADLFPAAKPINTATVPASMRPLALCSDNFAVLYSQTSKTPASKGPREVLVASSNSISGVAS